MTLPHAVVWTDHHSAQVLRFNADAEADTVQPHKLRAHHHPTGQHGSAVRAEHESFKQLLALGRRFFTLRDGPGNAPL